MKKLPLFTIEPIKKKNFICLIAVLFFLLPHKILAQKNSGFESLKKVVEATINEYYAIVNQVTNVSCPRGKSNRIHNVNEYIDQITADYFDPNSQIYVSYLTKKKFETKSPRPYKTYFSKLSSMCSGDRPFDNVKYSVKPIIINQSDIECLENQCKVKATVRQKFSATRPNGDFYCDITTKIFTIITTKRNNFYEAKISEVFVKFTESCD